MLAALAAAAFVAYGSLVPFDFRAPTDMARELSFRPLSLASRTDFVSNVLLFLPTGFFLMGAFCAGRPRMPATPLGAILVPLLTTALAWTVEWSQQFLPTRTPSWNDVLAAGVASGVAVALWLAGGEAATRWANRMLGQRQPRTGVEAVLILYAIGTGLLLLLPLDLTIRPTELIEKYRNGRIILAPFASMSPFGLDTVRGTAASVLLSIPFGLLGLVLWMPPHRVRRPAAAYLLGLLLATAIEAAQIFVFSRVFDVTDLVMAAAGVAVGVWAGRRIWSRETAVAGRPRGTLVLLGLLTWMLILLAQHWYPFDFAVSGELIRARIPELLGIPFRAYYSANPFDALSDAALKGALSVPVGMLLWLCWPPGSGPAVPSAARNLVLILAASLFFGIVEAGQLLLPSRYPDVSDVLIGMGGTALGLGLMTRLVHAPASRM